MIDLYHGPWGKLGAAVETGGGGPHDGGMEARVAKLESDADHIKKDVAEMKADLREIREHARQDFRVLFGSLIAATLGLAGLMAKGFNWM